MSREKIDWSTFSDDMGALDLFGTTLRRSMGYDSYTARTRFKARALTDMFELSTSEVMAIDGGSTGGNGSARYGFKARIIGENSPHSFIPDPCDPSLLIDENATYRQIALHTTFLSNTADSGENVTRGDIVVVEVDRSDHSYDLEYGRFVSVSSHEAPTSGSATAECSSLVNLVGNWGGPTNHVGTGQVVAPVGNDRASGPVPSATRDAIPSGNLSFTLQELLVLRPIFMPLLDLIASTEGGKGIDGYDMVNNGTAPKSGKKKAAKLSSLIGRKMTSMSVSKLRQYMSTYKCSSCGGWTATRWTKDADDTWYHDGKGWPKDTLFATGRYQVIPESSDWYKKILGNSGILTVENQDAVGLALALMKRQTLGKYLLGKTNSEINALDELAAEWASFPIYTAVGKCQPGQSKYCGDGTNRSHHDLNKVLTTIRSVRAAVLRDQNAIAVLQANTSFTAIV